MPNLTRRSALLAVLSMIAGQRVTAQNRTTGTYWLVQPERLLRPSWWNINMDSLEGGLVLVWNDVTYTVSQDDLWRAITGTEPPRKVR